ncbi:MAG: DUF4097 family beta strand repeat protein [Oscillospiraceae bacterium]|nr:DUF4097 family beta strand repeat protein [Oscillospiraceae bacterium]
MSKRTKVWLWIAAAVITVGCIAFCAVMTVLDWDFSKLSLAKYETRTYEIEEEFENVFVNTNATNVVFLPSSNGKTKVVCHEREQIRHDVQIQDGTLVILESDAENWTNFAVDKSKITVYLPKDTCKKITARVSTGDIHCSVACSDMLELYTKTGNVHVENISSGPMNLLVSTGKITIVDVDSGEYGVSARVTTGEVHITDLKCRNFMSRSNTGDTTLDNVIASEKITIERTTGDVNLNGCDANEIDVKTDTGDITMSLLSGKVFTAKSNTGKVEVPDSIADGGTCTVTTRTGNIQITIAND